MTALSINLNKIALIRNSREGNFPNILDFAETCIDCGVDGITVHPRPDQRHIRPNDVRQLAQLVAPLDEVEFNIEGNPFADPLGEYPGLLSLVEETLPEQCTLVPDSDSQLTSDHGFDLKSQGDRLIPIIAQIKSMGVRVSLFMDPDLEQIKLASKLGADRIELYTGPYAAAWGTDKLEAIFKQHFKAAELAASLDLGVNAGHDLNLINLGQYASIPDLLEVSIGHAFTVDSLNMGMVPALRAYQALLA
ncbi:MAG: pyridoxine 5'-phosphate synthase [Porticoccaceae bacterium]|nr:pyridoxine 5'-phosphate synthase [Porticoccaceae bacterium]